MNGWNDALGRISKSTRVLDGTTYVTTSVYDGLGRLKDVTYPGTTPKTVEYLYTGPVLDKVQDKAGSGTTIYATYSNYTSQGQAQTITYGNGVVTTSTFADPAHPACVPANSFKLCTLKTQKGTNPLYQNLTYTFTADGNVDLITDPLNGNQDFGYDALDRLTSAIGPYGTGGATATFIYTYNQIGNMLSNPQVGAYTYPTSGAGVVRPHAATVVGPYPLTYDNNGNMVTMTDPAGFFGYSRTYNVDNRLSSLVTTYAGVPTTSTFVYDGDGGRVKKIVGSTTTRYISKLYECDTTGTNTSCSRFIWANDTRVATVAVTSGTVHYWHGDHLGSSSVITDSTGAKVQAVTYYPYGDIRTNQSFTTPAVNVPYKYTGKELDTASNLYFYEARYYHAIFGRFISPDTIVANPRDPQDLNRYTYAGNNPLKYTDPSGHIKIGKFFKRAFGDIGTTLVGVAVGGFTGCWTCAAAIMSQSESGRYTLTGAVLATTTVATFWCGGCGGWAAGAAIGAWTGAAVGGYSAHMNGGDLSSGILFGSSVGALTGGIAGQMVPAGFQTLLFGEKVGLAGVVGGIYGGGSGAAQGFAGGKGTAVDIFQSAGIGFGIGAVTAAGLQAVAPPLSMLAAKIGNINLATSEGGNYTLKNLYDALSKISISTHIPNNLASLAPNVGQFLDVNRALILGGAAALGTGAAFNYDQVLPFVQEKCAVDSPCTPIKGKF